MNLSTIKILWRQSDTMALYGVPYAMRPGQSPSDLTRGIPFPAHGHYGAPGRCAGPRDDWMWLGSPGWWGSLNDDEQGEVRAFLEKHKEMVPSGPGEWSEI